MNQFLEVAIDAAREAGALLRTEFDRPKKISYKGEVDIVTESDRRSEEIVVGRLRRYFPQHDRRVHAVVHESDRYGAAWHDVHGYRADRGYDVLLRR